MQESHLKSNINSFNYHYIKYYSVILYLPNKYYIIYYQDFRLFENDCLRIFIYIFKVEEKLNIIYLIF